MKKSNKKVPEDKVEELARLRDVSKDKDTVARVKQQHKKGKLTARERLELFLDEGTFEEIDPFVTHRANEFGLEKNRPLGDAVVTGYGKRDGRQVFVYAQDFTVFGGSVSEAVGEKICKVMDLALRNGSPIIGFNDSGGARIQEGVSSLAAYGDIFFRNTQASGVIPQISVVVGPSAGGAVYSPAITDFVFMVKGIGQMYITGPDVIKSVTGEDVTHEELGGTLPHSTKSGLAHFIFDNEEDCFRGVSRLLSFLPSNNLEDFVNMPYSDDTDIDTNLASLVPSEINKPYDIRDIIHRIVDSKDFMEVQQAFAPNIVVGFARLSGGTVGIVANQPNHLAGVLDVNSSTKAARFVRFCDCFNIPILTFVDVPGYMPGVEQEYGGIIRHGAKLIYAYAEATVPKISVLIRKAVGGAYIVMSSKHLRGDINLAWPSAQIEVMGAEGAVNIIHRKRISDSDDPEGERANLQEQHRNQFANPYIAARRGFIDNVIDPSETRDALIKALGMLRNKRDSGPPKKHGNIPL